MSSIKTIENNSYAIYTKDTEGQKMELDGVRVMLRRKKMGLTQRELADSVEVVQSYISRIENNEAKNVTLDLIDLIAKTLKTNPGYFLGLTNNPDPDGKSLSDDKELNELLRIFQEMGTIGQAKLLEIAKVLKE